MRRFLVISIFAVIVSALTLNVLFPKDSEAIPSFARKYGVNCSMCHVAWPQLNKVGRDFKERGYKFDEEDKEAQVISDFLRWGKTFPISAVIVSRPFDKRESGDRKIRALHEVEVIAAGVLYKNVSGFVELEAEDEEDFEPEIPHGVVSYHPLKAVNLQLGFSPVLWSDPYDTYSDVRRLTRGTYSVIDRRFGGADNDGRLRDSRQVISIYGRPLDMLFYSIGYSGVAEDAEGENADNFHARLAADVIPQATIGLFGMSGRWHTNGDKLDFTRFGVDAQADFNNIRLTGAYLYSKDDLMPTGDENNDAWYLQAFYVLQDFYIPKIVPLIRYDGYEDNDGNDQFDELTLNISFYLTENIKGFLEYWAQLDVPSGVDEDSRFTIQLAAGF